MITEQLKHVRGDGPFELAADYASKYPGVICNDAAGSINRLIRAIAFTLAFNMICSRECDEQLMSRSFNGNDKKTLALQLKLKDGDKLIGYLAYV